MKSAIKWRPQDEKKITSQVRKFNAAITRLEKKRPELKDAGVLPERLDVKEVKSGITTRKDFNKFVAKTNRLFKKGAQDLVKTQDGFYKLRWQQKEERYLERSINYRRKQAVDMFKLSKQQQEFLNLRPLDFQQEYRTIMFKSNDMENNIQEWYNFLYTAEREAMDLYYSDEFMKVRPSYYKALRSQVGGQLAEDIISMLENADIYGTDILYAIGQDDALGFEFIYSLEEQIAKGTLVKERWEKLIPTIKKQRDKYNKRNR